MILFSWDDRLVLAALGVMAIGVGVFLIFRAIKGM
jgi:hypothetical protein